jgi:hypothetical protein
MALWFYFPNGSLLKTLYTEFRWFIEIKIIFYVFNCLFVHIDGVRLCLRTAATERPIVYPPDDIWVLRATVE